MTTDQRHSDTIAAIATPAGRGGVGVIRLSGPEALTIGKAVCAKTLQERVATYTDFQDRNGQTLDRGIAIYFAAPKSFTGDDTVEIQGHGGPVIQDLLLNELLALGARQARPGEYSERAYLNNKIDLAQAEAIADLIDSSTAQAAKGATRSLRGEFSKKVQAIQEQLINLRMYVEAAIDFPEEEIDFLADEKVQASVSKLHQSLAEIIAQAGQGAILRNGFRLALAGKPNAGKSSLLNALAGHDAAIVTAVPGTTRDTITETIDIDGLPVHIIDTAGLRASDDLVEKLGIERAHNAIAQADHVLELIDITEDADGAELPRGAARTRVYNKIDICERPVPDDGLAISATRGDGLDQLRATIKTLAGYDSGTESLFTARRRHLSALQKASDAVHRGEMQLRENRAGELLADELLQAQNALSQITGEFTADDLLGEIFAGFCIGK